MTLELIIKTIAVLVIIKALIILIAPQFIINFTKKMMKSKSSLRKFALIYLIVGIIVYFVASKFG